MTTTGFRFDVSRGEGEFSSEVVAGQLERLRTEGSVASPGFMQPEGVVVYMSAARKLFKVTLDGDGHKTAKPNKQRAEQACGVGR